MAYKGRYKVKNIEKYKGDPTNVIYRSSWELKFMNMCDRGEKVLEWSSEEVVIPYKSPIDGRYHRYFPDFKVKMKTAEGSEVWIVEVKPFKETVQPKVQKRRTKRYINEVMTWGKNSAKWEAAEEWCADRGYVFKIITENELKV